MVKELTKCEYYLSGFILDGVLYSLKSSIKNSKSITEEVNSAD